MIDRILKPLINNSFFLFGPRQTGKSTLIRTLFPEKTTRYYDLLKSEDYLRLSANPSLFREEVNARPASITHMVLDEIQRIPELLNEVHLLLESPNPPHFIMTGSSARKLKRAKANLLAGRALTYNLHPLTVEELGETFSLQKGLRIGTLPSIYLAASEETAMEKLRSYVETYLREEIEVEAQIRNQFQFVRFLSMAGFENGNILNYSNMARETGNSIQTVKTYFQILEDTLIGQFLFPFAKSSRKRLARHPKFYFFDPGIVRALTRRLNTPLEPKTPEFGRAFEHFIFLEVMRENQYRRHDWNLSFYRTEAGSEVDIIVETPSGQILAVEIKASNNVNSSDLTGLRSFSQICPSARLACVSLTPHRRMIGPVTILPWQELLGWVASLV